MKKLAFVLSAMLIGIVGTSPALEKAFVPSYNGKFTIGLTGFYFKPSDSALDYALITMDPFTLAHSTYRHIEPDYGFGYRIDLGYLFPCTGSDINFSYADFRRNNHEIFNTVPSGAALLGTIPPFDFAEFADPISGITEDVQVRSSFKSDYRVADITLGQSLNLNCKARVRFFSGIRYADLYNDFNVNYFDQLLVPGVPLLSTYVLTAQHTEFKGIGPRLGTQGGYYLNSGFGVVGQASMGLLVGNINSHYGERSKSFTSPEELLSFSHPAVTRVVPNMTAKLGLQYSYQLCNANHTKIAIEAGYCLDHYFNSLDRLSNTGVLLAAETKQVIDSSYDGPYLNIYLEF